MSLSLSSRLKVFAMIVRTRLLYSLATARLLSSSLTLLGCILLPFSKIQAANCLMRAHRNARTDKRRIFLERTLHKWGLLSGSVVGRLVPTKFRDDYLYPGRVFVLKERTATERGVIIVKYNETLAKLRANYDLEAILADYFLAFELSYYGCCTPELLQFLDYQRASVVVGVVHDLEERFFERLGGNIYPAYYSSSTWVDHRLFCNLGLEKKHDLILVGMWNDVKRHYIFFQALKEMADPTYRVCLVGWPWGRVQKDMEEMAEYYGVRGNIEFHEKVPPTEVNRLLNQSKVNILLSLKEGGNKAIIEGMLANVPAVVLTEHVGVDLRWINPETGTLADRKNLAETLTELRTSYTQYSPRDWVLRNISCERSTAILQNKVSQLAQRAGEEFTTGLAVKVNSPECAYFDENQKLEPFDFEKYRRKQPLKEN